MLNLIFFPFFSFQLETQFSRFHEIARLVDTAVNKIA